MPPGCSGHAGRGKRRKDAKRLHSSHAGVAPLGKPCPPARSCFFPASRTAAWGMFHPVALAWGFILGRPENEPCFQSNFVNAILVPKSAWTWHVSSPTGVHGCTQDDHKYGTLSLTDSLQTVYRQPVWACLAAYHLACRPAAVTRAVASPADAHSGWPRGFWLLGGLQAGLRLVVQTGNLSHVCN